jgi:hypothetical protein
MRGLRRWDQLLFFAKHQQPTQRDITDEKTRRWVVIWPNELRAVNEFRRTLSLLPLELIYEKRSSNLGNSHRISGN